MKYRNENPGGSNRWYHWAAWKGINGRRLTQLRAEPLCRFCKAMGRITEASVADHINPHRGDHDLFWKGELQSLCATHHNVTKQQIEERGYHSMCDENGWPLDPNHPANRRR